MPTTEVFFEVYCAVCGQGMCDNSTFVPKEVDKPRKLMVTPCHTCLERYYLSRVASTTSIEELIKKYK